MQTIAVGGLDLAKTVFQVHGASVDGSGVVRRQLRRGQVLTFFQSIDACRVGIEACASAHHWARELMAIGHEVRLMPPAYVKAYVKRGKTDAADAEAIAEAVARPTMRFVAVKSKAQQAVLMLHKTRDLLICQRTMLINALRRHLGVCRGGRRQLRHETAAALIGGEVAAIVMTAQNPRLTFLRAVDRFFPPERLA